MDHEAFISIVEQHARVDRGEAERAAHAALETLGDRIDREEARQIAAQLPPEDAPWIGTATPAEGFDADEFVRRVSEREGVDARTARRHAEAVLHAVWRAVDAKEWADMAAELPSDFAPLLPRGPHVDVVDADNFVREVAQRAGLGLDQARRAADAVLETLAQRIAGGEVDDLVQHLPMELHEPLKRGRAATGGSATPMEVARFVELVAAREGVPPLAAAQHARAVFLALRDAVGSEFLDVTAQLPGDYDRLMA
jgi:uncharacterized protein (DUF2267 family)